MAMIHGYLKDETLRVIGDNLLADAFTEEQKIQAVNQAMILACRANGYTYLEDYFIADSYGFLELPNEVMANVRVYPVTTGDGIWTTGPNGFAHPPAVSGAGGLGTYSASVPAADTLYWWHVNGVVGAATSWPNEMTLETGQTSLGYYNDVVGGNHSTFIVVPKGAVVTMITETSQLVDISGTSLGGLSYSIPDDVSIEKKLGYPSGFVAAGYDVTYDCYYYTNSWRDFWTTGYPNKYMPVRFTVGSNPTIYTLFIAVRQSAG